MTLQVDFWQLVGLLLAFFGVVAGFFKLLMTQQQKLLDERFAAQEKARDETRRHWDTQFAALQKAAHDETAQWQHVERELLRLKADLPEKYVLREDFVKNQTIIEGKLDRLALKIENLQLRGNHA